MTRSRPSRNVLAGAIVAGFTFGVVTGQEVQPGPPDIPAGLVRALEGIGQNILGTASFFANPGPSNSERQPGPPTLKVWLDEGVDVPININVFQNPGPPDVEQNPGPPTTWLRITVQNGEVTLQREQDTTIGNPDTRLDFANLSTLAPPNPVRGINPGPPNLTTGLIRAFEGIGQNILGEANFFVNPGPPDAAGNPGPPNLNLWVDDTPNVPVHINVFVNPGPPTTESNPGPPTTWLRITISNGEVTLQREQDATIGNPDLRLDFADLSAFHPPNPIQRR